MFIYRSFYFMHIVCILRATAAALFSDAVVCCNDFLFFTLFFLLALNLGWTDKMRNIIFSYLFVCIKSQQARNVFVNLLSSSFSFF